MPRKSDKEETKNLGKHPLAPLLTLSQNWDPELVEECVKNVCLPRNTKST